MKNLFRIIAFVAVVVCIGCCPCRKMRYEPNIIEKNWHLVELMGESVDVPADQFLLVVGDDGNVSGVGACNRFTATYERQPEQLITIGHVGSTRMLCPENEALEGRFFAALPSAKSFAVDGNIMMLMDGDKIVAMFEQL